MTLSLSVSPGFASYSKYPLANGWGRCRAGAGAWLEAAPTGVAEPVDMNANAAATLAAALRPGLTMARFRATRSVEEPAMSCRTAVLLRPRSDGVLGVGHVVGGPDLAGVPGDRRARHHRE